MFGSSHQPPSPEEIWRRISAELADPETEVVARRSALNRVLSQDLAARVDSPATDVSAMDGYAVTAQVGPGDRLEVAGTIAAGDPPGFELPGGHAARIMTGAPVPAAAVAVVPVEHTDGGSGQVIFDQDSKPGANIRRAGEVFSSGAALLPTGHRLTPGALSLLASQGYDQVPAYRRPRVASLATGDEVVPAEREPGPGQLRDSHTDFLLAAGASQGIEIAPLGIAPDRREALLEYLQRGLDFDVLLVTGGVSMGEFDYVEDVLSELGCRVLSDSVAIQPGKPLVVARHDAGWILGLPGNPASVMACFWLFARPLLRSLSGHKDGFWHGALSARTATDLPGARDRDRFLATTLESRNGELWATTHTPKGSHDLLAAAHGSALLRLRAGAKPTPAGSACEVLPTA